MALAVYLFNLLTFSSGVLKPLILDVNFKIVNGRNAELGDIPYQISLQMKPDSFHICGGSILNENYVITAAHCVYGRLPSELQVATGIDLAHPISTHEVKKIIIHEEYTPDDSWHNDIALLKVKNPFLKSNIVKFVPLPAKGSQGKVMTNDKAIVSGWGAVRYEGPNTNKLQYAELIITDQDYCASIYKQKEKNIDATQICANNPQTSKGSCQGDSGGPLTINGVLVGLVSWAAGCASVNYPTVYTRVSYYLNWIEANTDHTI